MKGLMIFSKGFEESEAIITIDLLRRAKINIDLVSMNKDLTVESSHNVKIICEKSVSDLNLSDYSFLVIPGGSAVFEHHLNSLITESIVNYFINNHLLIAAICAAPMILGKYGHLENKQYICFPGCEKEEFKGILNPSIKAITDGNIITGKACGTTFEFGYEIIKYLKDEKTAKEIINSVYYQFTTKA